MVEPTATQDSGMPVLWADHDSQEGSIKSAGWHVEGFEYAEGSVLPPMSDP